MPEIICIIDEDGNTTVEASGVSGPGCQALTRAIEAAIGQTTSDVKKPEFGLGQAGGQAQGQEARA